MTCSSLPRLSRVKTHRNRVLGLAYEAWSLKRSTSATVRYYDAQSSHACVPAITTVMRERFTYVLLLSWADPENSRLTNFRHRLNQPIITGFCGNDFQ